MTTLREAIENIRAEAKSSAEEEARILPGDLVEQDKAWEISDSHREAAIAMGLGMGYKDFYPILSPNGRIIRFSFPTARQNQLGVVDAVLNGFEKGYDVLLDAPTGTGKAPICLAVAAQHESAWLLIGRNDLVDQWENDFQEFRDVGFLKARHRFDCTMVTYDGKTPTCSAAKTSCKSKREAIKKENEDNQGKDKKVCPACPYAVNRDTAFSKSYTCMTLSMGLTLFKYLKSHPAVKQRDVLIIDECSEVESEIMRFFECAISTKTIFKAIHGLLPIKTFFPDAASEFYQYYPSIKMNDTVESAFSAMIPNDGDLGRCCTFAVYVGSMAASQKSILGPGQQNEERREICDRVVRMASNMMECINDGVPHYAKVEMGKENQYTVTIAPLEARGMIGRLLRPFGKRILFSSATTGNAKMFTDTHAYAHPLAEVQVPSSFPVENRRVYALNAGNMSRKTQATDMPAVLSKIKDIISSKNENERFNHASQKGIIHTYNNQITDQVIEYLRRHGYGADRVLALRGSGKDREQVMTIYKQSTKPMILVSPSAMLGLSLNDDMGRWQIIAKVPYPYLGDKSVEHRMNVIPRWYDWQTAKDMIQTFGRVVRSETDWGSTYILDTAFVRFYENNIGLFPAYIREALWVKP